MPGAESGCAACTYGHVILRTLSAIVIAMTVAQGATLREPARTPAPIGYEISTGDDARSRLTGLSAQQVAVLEALNRADARHFERLDALVFPDTWFPDVMRYSPFPDRYSWATHQPKTLVVHQPAQAFAAYESGELVRWGPISSGRESLQTPAGLFHLNWRSPGRHSTVDPDWFMRWYFNFENDRGLSFHQYSLPGHPASHACVRLLQRDAKWLFEWGETWKLDDKGWTVLDPGTPVLIVGCYEFASRPPWRSLEWLASGIALPPIPITNRIQCR